MRPRSASRTTATKSFPRVSGDAPVQSTRTRLTILFSPRERGCARLTERNENQPLVFPA